MYTLSIRVITLAFVILFGLSPTTNLHSQMTDTLQGYSISPTSVKAVIEDPLLNSYGENELFIETLIDFMYTRECNGWGRVQYFLISNVRVLREDLEEAHNSGIISFNLNEMLNYLKLVESVELFYFADNYDKGYILVQL